MERAKNAVNTSSMDENEIMEKEPTKNAVNISSTDENNTMEKEEEESCKTQSLEIMLQDMTPIERELTIASWERKLTRAERTLVAKERQKRKHTDRQRRYRRKKAALKKLEPKESNRVYSSNPVAVKKREYRREYRQRSEQLKKYSEETDNKLPQNDDTQLIKPGSLEYQLMRASLERKLTRAEINTLAKERAKRKNCERVKLWRQKKAAEMPRKQKVYSSNPNAVRSREFRRKLKEQMENESTEASNETSFVAFEVSGDNTDYIIKTETDNTTPINDVDVSIIPESKEDQLTRVSLERKLTRAELTFLAKQQAKRKHNERMKRYRRKKAAEMPKKQKVYSSNPSAVIAREYRRKLKEQREKESTEASTETVENTNDSMDYTIKTEEGWYQSDGSPQEGTRVEQRWHQCPRCSFWFDCRFELSYSKRLDECTTDSTDQMPLTDECTPDTTNQIPLTEEYPSNSVNNLTFPGEDQLRVNNQTIISMETNTTLNQKELGIVVTPQFDTSHKNISSSTVQPAQNLTPKVGVKREPQESHMSRNLEKVSGPSVGSFSSTIPIFQSTDPIVDADNTIKQEPFILSDTLECDTGDVEHYVKGVSLDKALLSRFTDPTKLPVLTQEVGELMLFLKPRVSNTTEGERSYPEAGMKRKTEKYLKKNSAAIKKTIIKTKPVKKTISKLKSQKEKVNNSGWKWKKLPENVTINVKEVYLVDGVKVNPNKMADYDKMLKQCAECGMVLIPTKLHLLNYHSDQVEGEVIFHILKDEHNKQESAKMSAVTPGPPERPAGV